MDYYERRNGSTMQIVNCTYRSDDINCKSGLVYNYQTMKMISAFGPIITGLFKGGKANPRIRFSLLGLFVLNFILLLTHFCFISGNICSNIIKCISKSCWCTENFSSSLS